MQVKIDFKNGNRTVFNADCYDPNDLGRDIIQQIANGNTSFTLTDIKVLGLW